MKINMRQLRETLRRDEGVCMCWIAACFALTSAVYLSWLYHLMEFLGSTETDVLSMVVGYLFQAGGTVAGALCLSRWPELEQKNHIVTVLVLLFLTALPAITCTSLPVFLVFGLLMNFMCGVIAALYLHMAGSRVKKGLGVVFGGGYGLSTVLVWLLSVPGRQNLLGSWKAIIVAALLTVVSAYVCGRVPDEQTGTQAIKEEAGGDSLRTVWLAAGVVFLLSFVKNLGFSFPSADLETGVDLELSRLFYAFGLVAAGVISDRDRRYGAVCTMAALAVPFIMLAVQDEPVSRTLCWGLDYLFYGFFSVFRVVLFMELARKYNRPVLASMGLVAGRLGDAAGSALCIYMSGWKVGLIALTTVFFILATLLFFRLYHLIFESEGQPRRSEREIFETFAIRHDLSAREKEVLRLVLAEQSNAEIASALFVSESTIKYHVHNLLQKTGYRNRQDLSKAYQMMLYPEMRV